MNRGTKRCRDAADGMVIGPINRKLLYHLARDIEVVGGWGD